MSAVPPERARRARFDAPAPEGTKHFEVRARTSAVWVGSYHCGYTHVDCGPLDRTRSYFVNVPRRGVYVKHVGGEDVVVDPTRAVFFNENEEFRTSHPYGFGDAGLSIHVRPDLVLDVAEELDPSARERPDRAFVERSVPLDPRLELAVRLLFDRPTTLDPLELDECTMALVAALARAAVRQHGLAASDRRPAPSSAQRALAHDACGVLGRRFREPLGIDALARELGVSSFHLSRVYRAVFGTTLHAHRTRMRLGAAVNRIGERDLDLTALALSLGFSSHSHFTARFRAVYGVTPTALARACARGGTRSARGLLDGRVDGRATS